MTSPAQTVPDLATLWDFQQPALSEARFRQRLAALPEATGDAALVLQTQIARTLGLRRRFDEARAVLAPLRPQLAGAGAEALVRWHLEWGRAHASATHDGAKLSDADRDRARQAYRAAADAARAAGLDSLAVDALHMLPFTTADEAQGLAWTQAALDLAMASAQPEARRWEASLRNNLGVSLNTLGRHDEALAMLQQAVTATAQLGSPGRLRIAHWMVAHTLRKLGRNDEALAMQQRLERENADAGAPDPYVFEELALLHRSRGDITLAEAYEARQRAAQGKP